ncbi:HpcH/HpaI aldolase/citrate lyase family protein [Ornithinimicrobium faecis]|uniref:HpcH/HpaI aldolase/citrate lyase family protein n=1 Tax=Ornithinimicrobium faecis TaxID=2934158 RepID=UPI0021182D06|nr:CoA ester lyase [Ornithinimicrobium sp. HY1745]
MIPRSYLYVPGDAPVMLAKALTRGADALIVDLEDAVAPQAKDEARVAVARWLADLPVPAPETQIWVRVNPGEPGHRDARAVVGPAVTGLMVAKTESPEQMADLDRLLTEVETAARLRAGSIAVVPLLESAAAVLRAPEIAVAPRVLRLQVGEADLAADLGLEVSPDGRELDQVRSMVVLASAAARISPPVGPVSTDFRDLEAFRSSTRDLARRGYVGRACIHPAQIDPVHEVFTPSGADLARARDLVQRFDEAVAAGRGVVVAEDGRMVDEAVVRQARHLMERKA